MPNPMTTKKLKHVPGLTLFCCCQVARPLDNDTVCSFDGGQVADFVHVHIHAETL